MVVSMYAKEAASSVMGSTRLRHQSRQPVTGVTKFVERALRGMRSDDLRALIARHDAGAIVLRHVANFAWYTGGGDSRVDHANPLGVADILITPDCEYVVTSSIEAP